MATGTRVQPPAERDLSTQGTNDDAKRARDDSGRRAWPAAHASNPPLAKTLERRASAQQRRRACDDSGRKAWPPAHASNLPLKKT